MDIKNYKLIDYRAWVLGPDARKGINIKRLNVLRPKELELLDALIPYQDQRDDPGQAEWVTLHVIKLLDFIPGGIREVVVPTALDHDTGFYGFDPNEWKNIVAAGGQTEGELARRPHQNRGILIAGRVFQKLNYPDIKYHFEIADIIGDHDTRLLPTTPSGRILRAADYTWRVSLPCLEIYSQSLLEKENKKYQEASSKGEIYNKKPLEVLFLEASEKSPLQGKPPFNLDSPELDIARLEFVNTMWFKFREKSKMILLPEYKEELERVVAFYEKVD